MISVRQVVAVLFFVFVSAFLSGKAFAQTGNSSSINGTVTDPSGALIPNARVTIHNPVSGLDRMAMTDTSGNFNFPNVPFNPYQMTVMASGFASYTEDIELRSGVPLSLKVALQIAGSSASVTVEAPADLIETDPTAHTDVDRQLFDKLPLESASSLVSSLVTLASPGVAADSNGLFHGLGDHAENSFSIDGQPITDQQSKVFSNQIPVDSIQSMEVIDGAPPAEYGGKTSLIIDVTTRSGQGVTTPHGSITASYGSFGSVNGGFDLAYGGQKWGNFISASGLNSGRFLDPPEFVVMHDKGNEENVFDRLDYQLSTADSMHLNLGFSRSWFQTPNSYDSQLASPWFGVVVDNNGLGPNGLPVGPSDQRSQIRTFNAAPTWTRLLGSNTVLTLGAFVRHDQYNYYPSANPFADLGAPGLQGETVSQLRFLTNAGVRTSLSYVKGINNLKAGVTFEHTFLTENDKIGIVDPTFNAPCLDVDGSPLENFTDPSQCAVGMAGAAGDQANSAFTTVLSPFDLTRGGSPYEFRGHTDVKEVALYIEDTITKGSWSFNLGIRGDLYDGLSMGSQAEPRLGIAYNIKPSNTVLRVSYARTLEPPFNENLVLSSIGCRDTVLANLFAVAGEGCTDSSGNVSSTATPLPPGYRNEFHAGLQQAFGKHVVFDGEYIWKYTHNGYDFSVLGSTPITFPIAWHNAKIPGFTAKVNLTNLGGFTAYVVMSSVAARFFTPQIGGVGAVPIASAPGEFTPFRIDHDEKFNQTTHLQYQPWTLGPWVAVTWRFDSGLVAGAAPCAGGNCANGPNGTDSIIDTSIISSDQQFEAGLFCGAVHPAPPTPANPTGTPISSSLGVNLCPAAQYGSTFLQIPKAGTEDDDHNPPRVASRNLFDIAVGDDNVFHGDHYKWSARLTVVNVANKVAVYNFLSTFSGTHYVTPRAITGEIGFHF